MSFTQFVCRFYCTSQRADRAFSGSAGFSLWVLGLARTKPHRLNRLRKSAPPFCHSERSEESLFLFLDLNRGEIPRSARNDKIRYFFCSLCSLCYSMPRSATP